MEYTDYGFWPKTGKFFFSAYKLTKKEAYEKAVNVVETDPQYHICEISRAESTYSLKCWRASNNVPMRFGDSKGYHVLFYSKIAFKWKEQVPVKAQSKAEKVVNREPGIQ